MSSDTVTAKGQCACGNVTVTVTDLNPKLGACHCITCQRWGSGPFLTAESDGSLEFTGVENIKLFNSSEWAERAFCKNCGSHLYYRLKGESKYWLAAGLFSEIPSAKLDHQVFIDSKPSFYSFQEDTNCMTGKEVFAMFNNH